MNSDAVILVPIRGTDNDDHVEIPVSSLRNDYGDVREVLQAELAPYRVWQSVAAACKHLGMDAEALEILEEASSDGLLEYEEYSNDSRGRVLVINTLAALHAEAADATSDPTTRALHLRRAREHYTRAETAWSGAKRDPAVWVGKGMLLLRRGDTGNARNNFGGAAAQRGERVTSSESVESVQVAALLGRGIAEYESGLPLEALGSFAEALMRCPGLPASVRSAIGMCYLAVGETASARRAFERALKLDPECADALCGLVSVTLIEGGKESASSGSGGDGGDANGGDGNDNSNDSPDRETKIAAERIAEAAGYAARAVRCDPGKPSVLVTVARLALLTGDWRRCGEAAGAALSRLGVDVSAGGGASNAQLPVTSKSLAAEALYLQGRGHHALGSHANALYCYRAAGELCGSAGDPIPALHLPLGQLLLAGARAKGDYSNALQCFKRHIESAQAARSGGRGLGHALAGIAAARVGDRALARSHLERAGERGEIKVELARLNEEVNPVQAAADLESAISMLVRDNVRVPSEMWHNAGAYRQIIGDHEGSLLAYVRSLREGRRERSGGDEGAHPVEAVIDGTRAVPDYDYAKASTELNQLVVHNSRAAKAAKASGGSQPAPMEIDDGGNENANAPPATPNLDLVASLADPVVPDLPACEVDTVYNLAVLLETKGQLNQADALYRSILSRHAHTASHLRVAQIASASSMTVAHAALDAAQGAIGLDAAPVAIKVSGRDFPTPAPSGSGSGDKKKSASADASAVDIAITRAQFLLQRGKNADAHRELVKVVDGRRGPASRRVSNYALVFLGNIEIVRAAKAGDPKAAKRHLEEAYRRFQEAFKASGQRSVYAANGMGCVLAEMGYVRQAHEVFLSVRGATAGKDSHLGGHEIIDASMNLAHAACAEGKYTNAVRIYDGVVKQMLNPAAQGGNGGGDAAGKSGSGSGSGAASGSRSGGAPAGGGNPAQAKGPLVYAARALYQAEDYENACRYLTRSLSLASDDAVQWYNLALVRETMGLSIIRDVDQDAKRAAAQARAPLTSAGRESRLRRAQRLLETASGLFSVLDAKYQAALGSKQQQQQQQQQQSANGNANGNLNSGSKNSVPEDLRAVKLSSRHVAAIGEKLSQLSPRVEKAAEAARVEALENSLRMQRVRQAEAEREAERVRKLEAEREMREALRNRVRESKEKMHLANQAWLEKTTAQANGLGGANDDAEDGGTKKQVKKRKKVPRGKKGKKGQQESDGSGSDDNNDNDNDNDDSNDANNADGGNDADDKANGGGTKIKFTLGGGGSEEQDPADGEANGGDMDIDTGAAVKTEENDGQDASPETAPKKEQGGDDNDNDNDNKDASEVAAKGANLSIKFKVSSDPAPGVASFDPGESDGEEKGAGDDDAEDGEGDVKRPEKKRRRVVIEDDDDDE